MSWSLSFRGRALNFTCRGLVSERRSVRSFRDVFPVSRLPFLGFPRTHREEVCTCFPLLRLLAHLFRASEKHRVLVLRTCVLTPRPGGFGTSIPPFYSSRRGLWAGRDASTVSDGFRDRDGHPRRSEITKGSDTKRKTMHQCPPFGPVWCCQPRFKDVPGTPLSLPTWQMGPRSNTDQPKKSLGWWQRTYVLNASSDGSSMDGV